MGAYNREDASVTVTFTIFDAGAQVGTPVSTSISGHSGAQVNNIFRAAGQEGHATENAVIAVSADHEIFSYASVIDNNTTDPIFVRGAEDVAPQGSPANPTVHVGENGLVFTDDASHSNDDRDPRRRDGDLGVERVDHAWRHLGDVHGRRRRGRRLCRQRLRRRRLHRRRTVRRSGSHNGSFEFSHTFTEAGTLCVFLSRPRRGHEGTSGRERRPAAGARPRR